MYRSTARGGCLFQATRTPGHAVFIDRRPVGTGTLTYRSRTPKADHV